MTATISNSELAAWGERRKRGEIIMYGMKVLPHSAGYVLDYSVLAQPNVSRESERVSNFRAAGNSFDRPVPVATAIHESHQK